jgi:hypothetical protein
MLNESESGSDVEGNSWEGTDTSGPIVMKFQAPAKFGTTRAAELRRSPLYRLYPP